MTPETQPPARPEKRAVASAVLLFALGFAFMAGWLHLLAGNTLDLYASERSEKLEMLRRSGYAFSSAIFGSSHVHQGFDPRTFDATLAGTPLATYSFDLGVDGGSQVEQRVMALDFLEHLKPPAAGRPCFIMLETTAPASFSLQFVSHPRQINILDLESLRVLLQLPPEGYLWPNRIHHRLASFTAAFYHAIGMGMLSNRIFRPPYNEETIQAETANDKRGTHHVAENPYADSDIAHALGRRHFPPTPVSSRLAQGNASIMEDLHRAPNGNRAQLAWVVVPELKDLETYKVYPEAEPTSFGDVPVFDLGRPDLFPQLYDPSLWVDSQHMNQKGAEMFSRVLAQQLLVWSHAHPVHGCGG
jgi:hypothetical protein